MFTTKRIVERDFAGSRLKYEIEELKKVSSKMNLDFQVLGNIFRITVPVKSIVYANPYLINLRRGDIIDAFELASYRLNDNDLELSDEPLVMYVNLGLDNKKRINAPIVTIKSPDIAHPHVLQHFMCYGAEKVWKVDTTLASMMSHIINCIKMVPGSYFLSDALNPSMANYLKTQTKFKLPLT